MMQQDEQDLRDLLRQTGLIPVTATCKGRQQLSGERPYLLYELTVLIPETLRLDAKTQ